MASRRLLAPLLLGALLPAAAGAHALRLSTGEVTVEARRVQAVLQFARAEATRSARRRSRPRSG